MHKHLRQAPHGLILDALGGRPSLEHCPSTPARLPAPSAPIILEPRSSLVSEQHCPSTPASTPAPSFLMPLFARFSSESEDHCPSTPASLPAPSAPMPLCERFSLASKPSTEAVPSVPSHRRAGARTGQGVAGNLRPRPINYVQASGRAAHSRPARRGVHSWRRGARALPLQTRRSRKGRGTRQFFDLDWTAGAQAQRAGLWLLP